ncbi:MAG: ASCH domain-containing protein [Patescibacteria group bacterium]|jgi:ASC-1-like (ASCH) protein
MAGKTYRLRFREIDRDIFDSVRSGEKTVETRAATERYRDIAGGDQILFVCGRDSFAKIVKSARIFRSLPALLRRYRVRDINPDVRTAAALKAMYESFPGYREKIKKFGLIALELEGLER